MRKPQDTYYAKVTCPIDPQLRVHNAPILTRHHRRRTDRMEHLPAILLYVLGEALPAPLYRLSARHDRRPHDSAERLRAVHLERVLQHAHKQL